MATWISRDLFKDVSASSIQLSQGARDEFKDFLWRDLCAEFDAFHLHSEIIRRQHQYSPEFLEFMAHWRADEENHAFGFARIIELLYGESIESQLWKLNRRPSN